MRPFFTRRPHRGRGRFSTPDGSVLVVAMLIAILIAVSLTSYIKLALTSMTLSDRSYYQNAAMNLSEVGVEEAVFSFNRLDDVPKTSPQDAWVPYGWALNADVATRTLGGFSVGPGVTGEIKVHCTYYNPTTAQKPVVLAKATLNFPQGAPASKYIEVTLRKRALFPRGMVVRQTITASGGSLSLDSWDSHDDDDPSTPLVPYSTDPSVRRANATLATLSAAANAINIGNGNVFGYISTAPGGTVAYGSTAVLSGDFAGSTVETDRISHDFDVTSFPPVLVPTRTGAWIDLPASINGDKVLPRPGDAPAADGYYYYNFPPGTNINLSSGLVQITGKVVLLLVNHAAVTAVAFSGGAGMDLALNATVRIYTNGDVNISGSGFSNHNDQPSSCMLYGTAAAPGGQQIVLKGNGQTAVSLFSPNADITLSGGGTGGDFFGALVGNSVRMNGTTRFHYDEALARLLVTGNPYGIEKWRELQSADERSAVAAKLGF